MSARCAAGAVLLAGRGAGRTTYRPPGVHRLRFPVAGDRAAGRHHERLGAEVHR